MATELKYGSKLLNILEYIDGKINNSPYANVQEGGDVTVTTTTSDTDTVITVKLNSKTKIDFTFVKE